MLCARNSTRRRLSCKPVGQSASKSQFPAFSIVVETANLATADHEGIIRSLDSIANQIPSPSLARAVVVLDSGEARAELLDTLQDRYEWISIQRIPAGMDYGDQKSVATTFASGEIVVFADSDCVYQPGWLASHLRTFASPAGDRGARGGNDCGDHGPLYASHGAGLFLSPLL